jgi:solute carrier family 25 (mitochondrial carnitine/acylcarnitine transporter), member 20/29
VQWGLTYPFDVLKSRIQTLPDSAPKATTSMAYNMKAMWKEGGLRAFTVGLPTTLVRAVPTNAVTFLMYERSLRWLNTFQE